MYRLSQSEWCNRAGDNNICREENFFIEVFENTLNFIDLLIYLLIIKIANYRNGNILSVQGQVKNVQEDRLQIYFVKNCSGIRDKLSNSTFSKTKKKKKLR